MLATYRAMSNLGGWFYCQVISCQKGHRILIVCKVFKYVCITCPAIFNNCGQHNKFHSSILLIQIWARVKSSKADQNIPVHPLAGKVE